jgi:hypothetical protein
MATEEDGSVSPRPHLYLVRDRVVARPSVTDVYSVLGGGWRATCECGATRSAESPSEGWDWVLEHRCDRSGGG